MADWRHSLLMPWNVMGWPTDDLLVAAGLAVLLMAFIMAALRHEVGLPFTVGLLVVPVVVAAGFALAVVIHVWLAVHLLYAAAILSGCLIAFVCLYEVLKRWSAEPPPPMVRY